MSEENKQQPRKDLAYRELRRLPDAYSRQDETDDAAFYRRARLVEHLDSTALEHLEALIGSLITEKEPYILDLMASIDSHIPKEVKAKEVIGLGMNPIELHGNPSLTSYAVHDLNKDPEMPFPDQYFDIVLNVVSIQYLIDPVAVFKEVARVLKPGGLHLVVFSDRSFPTKAVKIWHLLTPDEQMNLIVDYFEEAGEFELPGEYITLGEPRPYNDKYAKSGAPSDPIYAVYADRTGGDPSRPRRTPPSEDIVMPSPEVVASRKSQIKFTGQCPYCNHRLALWELTSNPMSTWNHDMLICINDNCPFLVNGWKVMHKQGVYHMSYRFCYDPVANATITIPVPNLNVIKNELGEWRLLS